MCLAEKERANCLYNDRFCELSKARLEIYAFYFPIFKSRDIDPLSIKTIYYEPHHLDLATSKSWGMTFTPVWWACDLKRSFGSGTNVVIDCGEATYKGFSVEDIDKFLEAIKPLLNSDVRIEAKFPFWKKSGDSQAKDK
uniref:Uncharacterized protein n=1 Tax=Plectus sambesii TaxID=2011161 RepID=A0A914W4F3_9BILA